jgi:Tfp pilus assembly PilM family ATPase
MLLDRLNSLAEESIVGLDITDDAITATRVETGPDGSLHLTHAGWVEKSPDASDRETASAIHHLWQASGIRTFTVASCLRSRSLTVKRFSHPLSARNELEGALRLEAERALQVPQEKLVIDWHLFPGGTETPAGPGQTTMEGVMAVVPRADVDRLLRLLRMAGLYPVVLDIACLAVCNLFLRLKRQMTCGSPTALVHLSRFSGEMAIFANGAGPYPRTFFARRTDAANVRDYLLGNIRDELRYHQFKRRRPAVSGLVVAGCVPGAVAPADRDAAGDGPAPETPGMPELISEVGKLAGVPASFWNPLEDIVVEERVAERLGGRLPSPVVSLGLALRRR